MNAKRLWLLLTGLLIVALGSSPMATRAGSGSDSDPKPAAANNAKSGQDSASTMIYLTAGSFDPLQSVPDLPQPLTYTDAQAEAAGTFIVQLVGPVLPEWKAALAAAGAELGDYLPDNAFLVHLDPTAKAAVQSLPFVRWIGAYQPGYKLSPDVDTNDTRSYRVILAPWADLKMVETSLKSMGVEARPFGQGISAVLSGDQINAVAQLPDVIWIEPYHLQKLYNDVAAATIMGGTTAWGNGYTGSGVTVAVGDTGLDTGNAGTIHQDFSGRVANLYSWPVISVNYGGGCATTNAGADDGAADKDSGHGTHVTGSVAGNGARSSGQYKGLAYEASIVMQAVEQYTTWQIPNSSCPNGYYLTGIPDDVRTLLQQAYNAGARVHNDSWGGGTAGEYDQQSAYFDDFIAQHPDMAIVVAAGNEGTDANNNGYVDENSISSPATAKNVLTVGASDNERASGGIAAYTWSQAWPSNYSAPPTGNDYTSDSRQELAAFSSRGPVSGGRIKPDVVAPGTNILSVRSSQATGTGWGVFNQYYMYMGGTSMASPLTAGAAALVRDYYMTAEGVASPSAALIKATLINSAVDITGYGDTSQEAGKPIPNNHEGWGLVNVGAATTPGSREFVDYTSGIDTGVTQTYNYSVTTGKPFKVSLVWSDKAGAAAAANPLVNNLNLRVTAPGGAPVYLGNVFSGGWSQTGGSADTANNVENVYIQSPAAGTWKVEVIGASVPQGPQPFALVVDGNVSPSSTLSVNSIFPSQGINNGTINGVVIHGTGFEASSTVQLLKGANTINGTGVVVNTSQGTITANINLSGAQTGLWDVKVTNTGASATLPNAFRVLAPGSQTKMFMPVLIKQKLVQQTTTQFQNPGFEDGQNAGWTESSSGGYDIIVSKLDPQYNVPIPTHNGNWLAWLGGAYDETSSISQQLTLPGTPKTLSFYYWLGSQETTCGNDIARVYAGGNVVWSQNLCSSTDTNGWIEGTANLSAYAGQTVTFQFYSQTDGSLNSNFFVDDVSLK